jgi:hypothetical protein
LLGILAVTFITLLLAAVGVISWPLQIVVDVIPVAFCLHLRAQARRAVAVARQRRRVAVASDVPVAAPAAPRWTMLASAAPAAEQQPVAATGTDERSADDTVTWEPVPVPRPTYTMKPPAPAYEADPTYSPPVYSPDSEPAEPGVEVVAAADGETDLDEILERRWAVND